MPSNISKEQFWKLYEKLPQELKDTLFAEETGDHIEEICDKYAIQDNSSKVVELVGQVLAGLILPEDFQSNLEKNTKIKKDIAVNVSREINRFIFYPVKESIAGLHKIEIAQPTNGTPTPAKPAAKSAEERMPTPSAATPTPAEIKSDTYRESIE